MSLRIGSLCSGFGGLDMAVMDVLDASVSWHAQYDPDDRHQYAARILAHHWPGIPNHGDITSIDWARVEPVDIITAGFPCQPISHAGHKKGHEDDRWLWPDVAVAVRALRPRLVFLENVSAILVRGFGAVADSLAAIGYDFAWTCLRASDVGGAHRRERWFCLAWDPDDDLRLRPTPAYPEGVREREPANQAHPLAGGGDARQEPRRGGVLAAADPAGDRPSGLDDRAGISTSRGGRERHSGRDTRLQPVPDASGDRWDEGRPEPARELGGPDAAVGGGAAAADTDRDGRQRWSECNCEPQRDRAPLGNHADGRVLDWGGYGPAIDRWEHVMGRTAPAPTEPGRNGPRLAPRFVEWMMGAPEGHITDVPGIPRNAQLKAAGNGVVPQQGSAALHMLIERSGLTQTTHVKQQI